MQGIETDMIEVEVEGLMAEFLILNPVTCKHGLIYLTAKGPTFYALRRSATFIHVHNRKS